MNCPACAEAERNPFTGMFQANCQECSVRAVVMCPEYHYALRIGRLTNEYKTVLKRVIGGDLQEAHDRVKEMAAKL